MSHGTHLLALRTVLLLEALDESALTAAVRSAADAVTIDLATPAVHGRREEARAAAVRYAQALAAAGRPALVRIADTRSGELDADVEAVVGEWLAAVILPGAEAPQDARDADVQIRKREMRRGMEPGTVRLVAEVDSADGLLALPRILAAVDRHSAVALSVDGLRDDLQLGHDASTLYAHTMADLAIAAHAARLPWILAGAAAAALATTAHEFGAAGVTITDETTVRGMNALFTPRPDDVAFARATLAEWDRIRATGARVGTRDGRLIDRRSVRRARALLARADAIARRERAG